MGSKCRSGVDPSRRRAMPVEPIFLPGFPFPAKVSRPSFVETAIIEGGGGQMARFVERRSHPLRSAIALQIISPTSSCFDNNAEAF
jgi:hypothetical protein